jgi:uncharacterized protein YggT (Ycf19 family)
MQIISGILMVYYFIIIISFILSWIRTSTPGMLKFKSLIHSITEPYMKHFRGISWLRFGMLDFSSILGIIVLSFLLFITQNLAAGLFPSWYSLVFWVILRIWGFAAFLIMALALLMIFRLITLYTMKGPRPNWIDGIDRFLFPMVSRFLGIFTNKAVAYPLALGIFAGVLIIFRYLAGWGLLELLNYLNMKLNGLRGY